MTTERLSKRAELILRWARAHGESGYPVRAAGIIERSAVQELVRAGLVVADTEGDSAGFSAKVWATEFTGDRA
jgi:hypothetical protein